MIAFVGSRGWLQGTSYEIDVATGLFPHPNYKGLGSDIGLVKYKFHYFSTNGLLMFRYILSKASKGIA